VMDTSSAGELVYCDQNFLIAVRDAGQQYQERVQRAVTSGQVKFVVGLWSLVEVARARDESAMVGLATVIDGLRPGFLRERRRLQRHEVEAQCFEYLALPFTRPSPICTLGEAVAELCNRAVPIGRQYSVVELAPLLRTVMTPIESAIEENAKARETNALAWKKGWIGGSRRRIFNEFVKKLLPDRTPEGLEICESLRRQFLNQVSIEQFPSVATEFVILEESLGTGAGASAQNFLDVQHGIALSHVRAVVSDDKKFTKLANRVALRVPFHLGRMITRESFDREFLGGCEELGRG